MMRAWSLKEIAPLIEGELAGQDRVFRQVTTDSRRVEPGDLYVAIVGERLDGHEFVPEAIRAGASALIVDRPVEASVPSVQVGDTRRALGLLARINRQAYGGQLAAITGSCGKTTTKEMLAAVLSVMGETLATQGNLNNDIGAPLTLFRLEPDTEYAVIELGASGLGEIAWTGSLASPDVGILTNASEAHLEGFGSLENIVQAKGELIDSVRLTGTMVLNHDDAAYPIWRERAGTRRVLSVSAEGNTEADLRPADVSEDEHGVHFELISAGERQGRIDVPLAGRHNVANALLVAAAAEAFSLPFETVQRGLASVVAVDGRLKRIALGQGITLLDDSYNANPASMISALETLAMAPGRRIAMLGDMAELGSTAAEHHERVGAKASELGIETLLVTGRHANDYARGFGDRTVTGEDPEGLVRSLSDSIEGPATVLVKGSRSAGMDRAVTLIKRWMDDSCFSG